MLEGLTVRDKIDILKEQGYKEITPEFLKNLKREDERKYNKVEKHIKVLKGKGIEPMLIIFFEKSWNIYSYNFIADRSIEAIIKGTERFLGNKLIFN